MADIIFADGFSFRKPHENAPDFVKGSISVKVDEAIAFLEQYRNEDGWVNIDLKKSKGGKLYLSLNTYRREGGGQSSTAQPAPASQDFDDDIPF